MSETNETPILAADAACASQAAKRPALGKSGLILLTLSLAAGAAFAFAHGFGWYLPGIGLTVSQWIILAAALILAARQGKLHPRRNFAGWFLLGCAVILGGCFGVFADQALRLMNLPVLLFLTAQALFSLTGQNGQPGLSAQGIWEGFRRMLAAPFRFWDIPFRAVSLRGEERRKTFFHALLGLMLSLPVLWIALALLTSADAVFSGVIARGFRAFADMDGTVLLRLILAMALGMALFSFLFSLLRPAAEMPATANKKAPPATFAIILFALAAAYGLFVYVQFRYLFGSAETAGMAGGYAEYARSGFFQLVVLALLTLALILPALALCPESRTVRSLCAAVSWLTMVMDYSAFFRMRLYIEAYGLSVLRIITLWGMAMILLALIACLVKCLSPRARLCPLLAGMALASWIALNCANVDRIVAENHVARYNAGQVESLDLTYLMYSLSPDVLPALEKIADEKERAAALQSARSMLRNPSPSAYDWSLCYLRLSGSQAEK